MDSAETLQTEPLVLLSRRVCEAHLLAQELDHTRFNLRVLDGVNLFGIGLGIKEHGSELMSQPDAFSGYPQHRTPHIDVPAVGDVYVTPKDAKDPGFPDSAIVLQNRRDAFSLHLIRSWNLEEVEKGSG